MKTHILVTGGAGQLGLSLADADWGPDVVLHRPDRMMLDLSSPDAVTRYFAANRFDAVVNAAAYTAVDKAQDDVAAAFAANATGPALLADATRRANIPLLHVSTDYVFDGSKAMPYTEEDPVAPLGVYGASKLAGEYAVLTGNQRSTVLRVAWVVSPHRMNFVKTMRRLAATRSELGVVADQYGSPTSAIDIAAAIVTILSAQLQDASAPTGLYHFVNAGAASWYDLAVATFENGAAPPPRVNPIATVDFPTPVRRPADSRLSTARLTRDYGIVPRPWQDAVRDIVHRLDRAEHRDQIA